MANLDLVHRFKSHGREEKSSPVMKNGAIIDDGRYQFRQVIKLYVLIGVPATLMLFFLNLYLLGLGAVSDISVNLGARVMLAYDGAPPRLENIGGIYPPVPFFMSLLLRDQLLATSVAGGFLLAVCLWFIRSLRNRGSINGLLEFCWCVYLFFMPQTLYVFSQRIDISLSLLLFCLTLISLRKTISYGQAYHMTISGLAMALLFLCDYSAGLIYMFFLPIVIVKCKERGDSAAATAMMLYLPLAFFTLIQFPMSLLFTGVVDPFLQWHNLLINAYNLHETIWLSKKDFGGWVSFLFFRMVDKVAFLLPWLAVGLVVMFRKKMRERTLFFLYFPAPLIYCFCSLVMGYSNFILDNASYLVFPAVALFLLHHDFGNKNGRGRWATVILVAALTASLAGGYRYAATTQEPMEKKFYAAILKGQTDQQWQQSIDLLNRIAGFDDTGKILMDSKRNMPLVFISGSPKRFLLPYQLDFEISLSLPAAYADYIVVHSDSSQDAVARRYPQALEGRLPGFTLIGTYGSRSLFKRATASY